MFSKLRTLIGIVLLTALGVGIGVFLWGRGPSEATVRKTVVTTIQDEAPASFLVTGTLDLRVTVGVDSSQILTPRWATFIVEQAQPGASGLLRGGARTQVQVPGTVSYGFDVTDLDPSMVQVEEDGLVTVTLPKLSVYSTAPDIGRLKVRTETTGWMRVLPSDAAEGVRTQALAAVEDAFRVQAEQRIASATQPRVNTARALEAMLRPALQSAGVESPRFRIRIADDLVLQPAE